MYPFIKRSLDVVLSGVALLVLMPLLLPIMIALLLTGEHYVFYAQERIGRHNRRFKILKFATMLKDSPNRPGGLHTTRRDPRVLPLGRFLRLTKINELPQVFNILRAIWRSWGPGRWWIRRSILIRST